MSEKPKEKKEKKSLWKREKKESSKENSAAKVNEDKGKPYKMYGLTYCGHCSNQSKIINGQIEGYAVTVKDNGKIAISQIWGEPEDVLKKTERSLQALDIKCKADKPSASCSNAKILLEDKVKELTFINNKKDLFNSARKKFTFDFLDDIGMIENAADIDKMYNVELVPLVIDSKCKEADKTKCKRVGELDPVRVILHDAIATGNTKTIDEVKNFVTEQRTAYVDTLRKLGKKKDADQIEDFYKKNSIDDEIKNWWKSQ